MVHRLAFINAMSNVSGTTNYRRRERGGQQTWGAHTISNKERAQGVGRKKEKKEGWREREISEDEMFKVTRLELQEGWDLEEAKLMTSL
ncbi:hypothetical protein BgiBS90_033885 [Biomphalaria glabrata]|nr:hypothetical protein BgiBS90_033885 [Biomphalaria glabrata]